MVEYTLEQLNSYGITKLKDIARSLGIVGFSKYKSGTKRQLAKLIIKKIEEGGEIKEETLDCDIDQNICEKSSKYNKQRIVDLAEKCGVDSSGSRREICKRLSERYGERKERKLPPCDLDQKICERSSKYVKSDIVELAEKCGVDSSGSRREICKRIAEKYGGSILKEELDCDIDEKTCEKSSKYNKGDIIALAQKCGVDSSGTRNEICRRLTGKAPINKDVDNLAKKYKKTELLQICEDMGLNCKKSWKKIEIAEIILRHQVQKPLISKTFTEEEVPRRFEEEEIHRKFEEEVPRRFEEEVPRRFEEKVPRRFEEEEIHRKFEDILEEKEIPKRFEEEKELEEDIKEEKCFGDLTREELKTKSIDELKEIFNSANINIGKQTRKSHMIQYLCELVNNDKCDPYKNIQCSTGKVCDVDSNVCISSKLADDIGKPASMLFNGHKLVGDEKILKKIRNSLQSEHKIGQIEFPKEKREDVEKILSEIQQKTPRLEEEFDKTKKSILKCLGMK